MRIARPQRSIDPKIISMGIKTFASVIFTQIPKMLTIAQRNSIQLTRAEAWSTSCERICEELFKHALAFELWKLREPRGH